MYQYKYRMNLIFYCELFTFFEGINYIYCLKLTPLGGIFSGNGAIFLNTDFSDLSDYQMNLYSFTLDFPNTDFSDLTDYQKNQMNLYSFPQLDSTSSSVIYSTFGLSLDRSISWHVFSPWQSLSKLSSAHLA